MAGSTWRSSCPAAAVSQQSARRILEGVRFLLRPGGGLLLGFPMQPVEPGQLGRDELATAAQMAGFTAEGSRVHRGPSLDLAMLY